MDSPPAPERELPLSQWVHGIARNVARKRQRVWAASCLPEAEWRGSLHGQHPWEGMATWEAVADLARSLLDLPHRLREVMTCRYVESDRRDEAIRRIGAKWGLSADRVRTLLRVGRRLWLARYAARRQK